MRLLLLAIFMLSCQAKEATPSKPDPKVACESSGKDWSDKLQVCLQPDSEETSPEGETKDPDPEQTCLDQGRIWNEDSKVCVDEVVVCEESQCDVDIELDELNLKTIFHLESVDSSLMVGIGSNQDGQSKIFSGSLVEDELIFSAQFDIDPQWVMVDAKVQSPKTLFVSLENQKAGSSSLYQIGSEPAGLKEIWSSVDPKQKIIDFASKGDNITILTAQELIGEGVEVELLNYSLAENKNLGSSFTTTVVGANRISRFFSVENNQILLVGEGLKESNEQGNFKTFPAFWRYDTSGNLISMTTFENPERMTVFDVKWLEGRLVFAGEVFQKGDPLPNLFILSADLKGQEHWQHSFGTLQREEFTHFKVSGSKIFLGGFTLGRLVKGVANYGLSAPFLMEIDASSGALERSAQVSSELWQTPMSLVLGGKPMMFVESIDRDEVDEEKQRQVKLVQW